MGAKKKRPQKRSRGRYQRGDLPVPYAPTTLEPAPVRAGARGGEGIYVKLPFPPEVVRAMREHADNGARLVELLTKGSDAAAEIVDHFLKSVETVSRDVQRVKNRARAQRRHQR